MVNKASVIIPCFNVEDYIQNCLDSVLLQGPIVHHTFVVNNNSTDETISKVLSWQKVHPDFCLTILEENNPGSSAARNRALALVETKWIQFLDADDLLLPKKIAHQIHCHPSADVICSGASYRKLSGEEKTIQPKSNVPLGLVIGKGAAGNTCSNLFSSSAIRAVGGWDESLQSSQEYDLMFRLWKKGGSFKVDPNARAIIRERENGQISKRSGSGNLVRHIHLRGQMIPYFRRLNLLSGDELEICYRHVFNMIRILGKTDPVEALDFFEQILSRVEFRPEIDEINSKTYVYIYGILGFQRAESIRRWLKKYLKV